MNIELNSKWHFAKQLGGRDDGPNDPMQANFKKTPYASLIRESIQNSLDVALDEDQPVRMEYIISDINANNYPNFFKVKEHIQECINYYNNDDARNTYGPMLEFLNSLNAYSKLKYIRVSDYNTTGMNYTADDRSQPFYAFVRAVGVTAKGDNTKGGSYGFGKGAYFYISPIRTLLVSTQTDTGKNFFEGVSFLCTHKYDEDGEYTRHEAVGFYDNNEGSPVCDINDIPNRFQRAEPGTDIFIMGINGAYNKELDDEKNQEYIYKQMAEAVLMNFWMAVEKNNLEVTIGDVNNPYKLSYSINSKTLPKLMDEFFPEMQDTSRDSNEYNPRPYWEAVHNAGCDKNHIVLDDYLENLGHVTLYALKNKKAQDKILYMRKPLMVVYAKRTQTVNGFYGVFVCDDDKGNAILRKTEDPAHKEWRKGNWQINGKVVSEGRKAMRELKQYIISAIDKLFPTSNETIQNIPGVADFLYILTADEFDDEAENDGESGNPVGQDDKETSSLSSDILTKIHQQASTQQSIGKVMVGSGTTTRIKRDKTKTGIPSGHGHQKKRDVNDGKMGKKNIDGRYNESDKGEKSALPYPIAVNYRTFAIVNNDGSIIHRVIIHSDEDYESVQINFIVGGEQDDDEVNIKKANIECSIIDNILCNVNLKRGKNTIDIEFVDNMKHALKLEPYEFK